MRRARRGEIHFAEDRARHKFKRYFKFAAGPICPRHHRDSHRAHAVSERRRGYLAPVYFFDPRDCVDFPRVQRNPFNRFDGTRRSARPLQPVFRDRVTEPIVERNQDRIHHRVPSRISVRRAHYFVGARATGKKSDRASLSRDRPGAQLGDSGDPIAERCLSRRRPRRDNRQLIAMFESVCQFDGSAFRMTEENGCSKGRASRCGARPVTQRTVCCENEECGVQIPETSRRFAGADPCTQC
jgi:hypothetical protein